MEKANQNPIFKDRRIDIDAVLNRAGDVLKGMSGRTPFTTEEFMEHMDKAGCVLSPKEALAVLTYYDAHDGYIKRIAENVYKWTEPAYH